jgi:RES domain-containing protein
MHCAWFLDAASHGEPASWRIAERLLAEGYAGLLTPSFAPGATSEAHNVVLWKWVRRSPHGWQFTIPAAISLRISSPGDRRP